MIRKYLTTFVLFFASVFYLLAQQPEFKLKEQWKHPEIIYGFVVDPGFVVDEGNVLVHFFRTGVRMVSKGESKKAIPYGEGPSEAKEIMAFFPVNDSEFAVFEAVIKIKIFSKTDNNYV